jgi:hypothetical protein
MRQWRPCRICGKPVSGAACPRCTLERAIGEETADTHLVRPYVRDIQPVDGHAHTVEGLLAAEPAGLDGDADGLSHGRHRERRAGEAAAGGAADWRFGRLIGGAVLVGVLASGVAVTALNLTSGPRSDTLTSLPAPTSVPASSASPIPVASPILIASPVPPTSPTPPASATSPSPMRLVDPTPRSATAAPTSSVASATPSDPTRLPATSRIIGIAGKCIDVPNANGVDGQHLNLWDCNGTVAQSWTFGADGTIRAFGRCMDVAWGSRDNGAVIQLANCSGNPAQQFVLNRAGDLVNPQSNKCVDVKDRNTDNGARLIQWDCNGGPNQKWRRG